MQISVYLCITYGIVIIEAYSCNKELYLLNTFTLYPSSFWLTPEEKRTKSQVLCIMVHLHICICNTLPPDNPKIHLHIALSYITLVKAGAFKGKRKIKHRWEDRPLMVVHQIVTDVPLYEVIDQWGQSYILHHN